MIFSDKVELGDVVCGIIVLGFEHCSPQGKVENHNETITEENGDMLRVSHHSEVYYLAIFKLARNLQFSLHRRVHHVHVWRVGPRNLQAKQPIRLLAIDKHASRFRAVMISLHAAYWYPTTTSSTFKIPGSFHALNVHKGLLSRL